MKPDCVTVKVDQAKKTVTITARLSFYTKQGVPGALVLDMIKRSLERVWSGHHFKCFTLIVNVVIKGVKDQHAVAADELDIELVNNIDVPYTWVAFTTSDRPLSDDPDARDAPERGELLGHSTWSTDGVAGEWAHEFGHVLGLDDGYQKGQERDATGHLPPIPGHSIDLMSNSSTPVSAQMITRLLRRLKVDESKIKCPITFDAGPSSLNLVLGMMTDLTLHAWACDWDPPSDDPSRNAEKISFEGWVTYSGGYLPGAGFSEARSLLGALTHMDLSPLATEHGAEFPLAFEIHPFTTSEKLVIKFADKLSVEGNYIWDAKEGLPVMVGPMSVMGMSSAGFFPGPPLEGRFKHGAGECPR